MSNFSNPNDISATNAGGDLSEFPQEVIDQANREVAEARARYGQMAGGNTLVGSPLTPYGLQRRTESHFWLDCAECEYPTTHLSHINVREGRLRVTCEACGTHREWNLT